MAPDHHRTQEQSIKARKHQLFESDERRTLSGPRQSFRDCLRETPATPLSSPIKAILWTVGVVVILLLIAAWPPAGPGNPGPRPPPPTPRPGGSSARTNPTRPTPVAFLTNSGR